MATTTLAHSLPKRTATISYFLSILALGLFTALGGPALPTLADNTSSSLDQISLFFVLGSLGYLLGSFFGGRAYDRVPGHRVLALTLLVVAGTGTLIPVIGQLRWLLLTQFILGLAQGANDVGCNTLLLWLHGKGAGPYMNGLHFFFGVGTSIAPLVLAGFLSLTGDIRWAFWVCTVLCLPLAFWLWRLPEIQPPKAEDRPQGTSVGFLPVALLVLTFALAVGAEFGFGNWIYTYALGLGLGTTITSAYITSAFWGTFTLGRLQGIWISTRLRPLSILILDLLGCLVSLSLIILWPESQLVIWLGTIGTGLFMASIFPTLLVLVGEQLTVTGSLTGWMLVGGGMGGMFFPWLIGQAMVRTSKLAMPGIVVGTVLLNLIAIFLFNSWTKSHPESI
jgi:FHS family Na+ dependent glucose MFS transporter 1